MRDNGAPSADGPEESTSRPIDDHFRAALALLWRAYDCAQDTHVAVWDFALEIGKLYEAGLAITDLRWLVAKGFVEHGSETSVYGDEHRSFACSDGFNFLTTTCVVLRKKGAAFACRVLQASAATKAAAEPPDGDEKAALGSEIPPVKGETQPQAPLKPRWDPVRRQLFLGDLMVKRFLVPARNQELVLGAFQEDGWPEHIDDPLPGIHGIDPRSRLNDVIYRLNHTQLKPLIRFHTNGNGDGVCWSLPDLKTMRQGPSAARELIAAV
jgi:hypothetical protein